MIIPPRDLPGNRRIDRVDCQHDKASRNVVTVRYRHVDVLGAGRDQRANRAHLRPAGQRSLAPPSLPQQVSGDTELAGVDHGDASASRAADSQMDFSASSFYAKKFGTF